MFQDKYSLNEGVLESLGCRAVHRPNVLIKVADSRRAGVKSRV